MGSLNYHVHTINSQDASVPSDKMCEAALNAGIKLMAITDHCDTCFSYNPNVRKMLDASFSDAALMKRKYHDKMYVAKGVEVGDYFFDEEFVNKLLSDHMYDVVLMSVHSVRYKKWQMPFSFVDFSDKTQQFIDEYLAAYFDDLLYTSKAADYDILCHLTVPLRYICKKYGKKADLSAYKNIIDNILKTVIARNKSLEINTSEYCGDNPFFMPDEKIIDRYIELGGTRFTTGSDAHIEANIKVGLNEAYRLLKSKGINTLCYYINRKEHIYKI